MKTLQQIFDEVVTHLLTQGEKAINSDGSACLYRYGSLKCAVGCLIKDEHYKIELEGATVDHVVVQTALMKSGVDANNCYTVGLLGRLQSIHDDYGPYSWARVLEEVANDYPVNTVVLDSLTVDTQ